ncbi:MAG: MFS transporter [Candidatus Heimdallarchaeota archaeon]|nr:MFS transporter [Candidatus Heimdallarchaeota archaeon]
MKIKNILLVIIPNTFTWLLASLLLLIYSFDILDYIENSGYNPFEGWGVIILIILLLLVILALYFTGSVLDSHPEYLKKGVLLGMLGSSITAIFFVITINISILMILCLIGLLFFFAILLTSSGTLFAGITDVMSRGKVYSISMFSFIVLVLTSIILGKGISNNFSAPNPLYTSWVVILPGVGVLGLVLTLFFYLLAKDLDHWTPDSWPTRFSKIIGRRSVKGYLSTHFLLYCMLGIAVAVFPVIGSGFDIPARFDVPVLGQLNFDVEKVFWFVVLLGDLILIIPAGIISDKIGRKNLIVLAIYGIVFSALILGLEKSGGSFLVAALTIGFSFALIHPTLDSSLWADLSPRDGLGRYFALGFISLALGLGAGYGIGHWIFKDFLVNNLDFITYFLIILAIVAAFPLFWISDSYEPLDFTLLMVIEAGGLPLFDYVFQKKLDTEIELTLLSGALTAVSSFMSETLKEKGNLSLVRHGNHFILTDKDVNTGISAVIFSNKHDPELKKALREFQTDFCAEYGKHFDSWNGARNVFDGAIDIAEKVFGHLAPSTNLDE